MGAACFKTKGLNAKKIVKDYEIVYHVSNYNPLEKEAFLKKHYPKEGLS
jgi:hypothetical protein